jgi:hypothetical protein
MDGKQIIKRENGWKTNKKYKREGERKQIKMQKERNNNNYKILLIQ